MEERNWDLACNLQRTSGVSCVDSDGLDSGLTFKTSASTATDFKLLFFIWVKYFRPMTCISYLHEECYNFTIYCIRVFGGIICEAAQVGGSTTVNAESESSTFRQISY